MLRFAGQRPITPSALKDRKFDVRTASDHFFQSLKTRIVIWYVRELEIAISASNSTLTPPPHHIGILMCAAGRFVQCMTCKLTLEFPQGAQYDAVVREMGCHSCSAPIRSNGDAPKVA